MGVLRLTGRGLIALPALLAALLMVWSGVRHVCLDLVFTAAETELSFWASENYQPTDATIARTGQSLELLLEHSPDNPNYLSLQAYFLSWRGYFSQDIQIRLDYNAGALATQQQAMHYRPAYRQGWSEVIEYASRATGGAQALAEAQTRLSGLHPSPE